MATHTYHIGDKVRLCTTPFLGRNAYMNKFCGHVGHVVLPFNELKVVSVAFDEPENALLALRFEWVTPVTSAAEAQQENGMATKLPAKSEPAKTEFENVRIVQDNSDAATISWPAGMLHDEVITWVQRDKEAQFKMMNVLEDIIGYPLDAAVAFHRALAEIYHWVDNVATPGFWGDTPPTFIGIEVGVNKRMQVPWGSVQVPGIHGRLTTGIANNPPRLRIQGEIRQGDKEQLARVIAKTKELLRAQSIYKHQALKISYEWMREGHSFDPTAHHPKFFELSGVNSQDLVVSDHVMEQLNIGLFWPIQYSAAMREVEVPLKRSVLLYGTYGVGKTLIGNVLAQMATKHGWTYIYLDNVEDLHQALHFAAEYAPAVLFAEDIDRHLSGDRTTAMDKVLNTIDGVDTKGKEIITVFTTNRIETINPAMLRPGRVDTAVEVTPPDAKAAIKLVLKYGRGMIDPKSDLTEVGEVLAGNIPATIREVTERAKIAAVARNKGQGSICGDVIADDIVAAAKLMKTHTDLLHPKRRANSRAPASLWLKVRADSQEARDYLSTFGFDERRDAEDILAEDMIVQSNP